MEYYQYLNTKKELYDILLQYLEEETDDDNNFHQLSEIIEQQKMQENGEEMTLFFNLLIHISNNHNRRHNLIKKIEHILEYFFTSIKQTFTNFKLFKLFKSNKLLLLFLIERGIINVDEVIANRILFRSQKTCTKYHQFFYPEIKTLVSNKELNDIEKELTNENQEISTNFEEKRKIGENISYICELIRNDSIDEFVVYINRNMPLLRTTIKPSIFETNSFLLKNEPSLIEYAAFYGSIQIFQYLKFNNNEFNSSLWIYSIHGGNPEIIHVLEENHVEPPNGTYISCYIESIKCHHNDIANYIKDVFLENEINDYKCIFQYYNFKQMPSESKNDSIFYYLCRYNYKIFVDLYLQPKYKEINDKIAQILTFINFQ